MEREDIETAIRTAFARVRLGSGVSLRQAQVIDDYSRGYSQTEFEALPQSEVIDDWTRVPENELIRDCVAHLDAAGLRYYLPALALWLLHHYDDEDRVFSGAEMTVIGTVAALAPHRESSYWAIYDGFSAEQKAALAAFVQALPRLVHLDQEDAARVERSLDHYWSRYLPPSH